MPNIAPRPKIINVGNDSNIDEDKFDLVFKALVVTVPTAIAKAISIKTFPFLLATKFL